MTPIARHARTGHLFLGMLAANALASMLFTVSAVGGLEDFARGAVTALGLVALLVAGGFLAALVHAIRQERT